MVLDFVPGDGAKLPGTPIGATVDVAVRAQDPRQSQLTSGVGRVEVRVDDGAVVDRRPTATDPSPIARVFVPGADDHRLTVRARDAGWARSRSPDRTGRRHDACRSSQT